MSRNRSLFSSSVSNSLATKGIDSFETLFSTFENAFMDTFSPIVMPDLVAKIAYPKFNSFRTKNGDLVIDLAVPYVTSEDVDVGAKDNANVITVTVKARQEEGISDSDYLVRQVPRSGFKQQFEVGNLYSVKDVKADLRNGILRLTVPYIKSVRPDRDSETRKIKIGY